MTVKLKRSYSFGPVIITVSFALDGEIASALLVKRAVVCDQPREKRYTHLQKPRSLQNQTDPSP